MHERLTPFDVDPAAPLHETAMRELIRAGGLIRRIGEPYFSRRGLSGAQWGVLRTLHRCESRGLGPPRVGDLGSMLLVQPPSISGVVDRLERLGLIVRTTAADDQRTRVVSLTDDGRAVVEQVLAGHSEWTAGIMRALTPGQQRELLALLAPLTAHLRELADDSTRSAPKRQSRPTELGNRNSVTSTHPTGEQPHP